jgi:hypothetical protein
MKERGPEAPPNQMVSDASRARSDKNTSLTESHRKEVSPQKSERSLCDVSKAAGAQVYEKLPMPALVV